MSDFESIYLKLLEKEGRLYTDEEALRLPFTSPNNPHHREWALRQQSFRRLKKYITRSNLTGPTLDLGCGNGWLTHHLWQWTQAETLGADINQKELDQAKRLFGQANCTFKFVDVFSDSFPQNYYQLIILNSVIQYFSSLNDLINRLLELLTPEGEIHILDSPFYQPDKVAGARQRSRDHFQKMGEPEMIDHYHHHSLEVLQAYDFEVLHPRRPLWERGLSRVGLERNPFPWIKVKVIGS